MKWPKRWRTIMWWTPARDRLVIFASTLGTVFEWYDFFIYGTLAAVIGQQFFPTGNETAAIPAVALATFAVGFGFRPVGAVLFGYARRQAGPQIYLPRHHHPDGHRHRRGRAGARPMPRSASRRRSSSSLLRVLQGLALGGEYGGAAIYVAEHAPREQARLLHQLHPGRRDRRLPALGRRGPRLRTASSTRRAWDAWGWRIPFLFSVRAARRLALGAAEAQGKPGLPGDEGGGRRPRAIRLRESFRGLAAGQDASSSPCSASPRGSP